MPEVSPREATPLPVVPTADEILAEAGEPLREASTPPERVAAALGPRRSGGGSRSTLLIVALVVLVVVVAVAWWLGLLAPAGASASDRDGGPDTGAMTLAAAEPARTPPPPPGPVSGSVGSAFSVALEAHRDAGVADDRLAAFEDLFPDLLWLRVPVEVNGVVFHRVLVGPAEDPIAAADLADAIGRTRGLDASKWLVRATSRAFLLGEETEQATADARAVLLGVDGVPAYVLAVPYTDGSIRFRVYAGAYADSAEASYMRWALEELGVSATLSERIGLLP